MQREQLIEQLGLGPVWKLRPYRGALKKGQKLPLAEVLPEKPSAPVFPEKPSVPEPSLLQKIAACAACGLGRQRKQALVGEGDPQPDWLIIGEAPGAEEDDTGQMFLANTGRLLDNMLFALGLQRGKKVYLTYALKCRPPVGHRIDSAELATCRQHIEAQIALLQPKIILLLGRSAASSVLQSEEALTSLRSRVHRYRDIPVVVSYHPDYLLRSPTEKSKVWADLCLARRTLQALM